MKIHWLQHVSFEGLGCIEPWLEQNGHDVSCTRLWAGDQLPAASSRLVGQASLYPESLCSSDEQGHTRSRIREACPTISDIDGLIVMGGPMGVYDDDQYPWLVAEKAFIKDIIGQNKPVLGICLGAQLIADVLGSNVWKNEHKEIGFFECRASVPLASLPPADPPKTENDRDGRSTLIPDEFTAFHWHGDTFGIPDGALRLASSEATENQAFLYKDNVLALQFHLETTEESLLALYENAKDEIAYAPFIQTLEEMQENFPTLGKANGLMFRLLNRLF